MENEKRLCVCMWVGEAESEIEEEKKSEYNGII